MSSLFKKLFKKSNSAEKEVEVVNQDMRVYARYVFPKLPQMKMKLRNGDSCKIFDLSYGGLSVQSKHETYLKGDPNITLHFFGQTIEAEVCHVYTTENLSGFAFRHTTPEVLLFLRKYIESIRSGHSCKQLASHILKAPYNQSEWLCYRGDGPCDIYLNSATKELLAIFPFNGQYAQLHVSSDSLHTGISEESRSGHSSAVLNDTGQVNPSILEKSILLLCGISNASNSRVEVEAFIHLLSEKLQKLTNAGDKQAG